MTAQQTAASAGVRRVPLTRRVLADLDTPLSVYAKLARGPHSFLLESVEGGEKWGRYSIIGLPARRTLVVRGHEVSVREGDALVEQHTVADPLRWIEDYHARFRAPPPAELPRFCGGLVGYFGYDTVRYVESRVAQSSPPDPLGTPDVYLLQVDDFVVFDNLRGELLLVKYVAADDAAARAAGEAELDRLCAQLRAPLPALPAPVAGTATRETDFESDFGHDAFLAAVERVKDYIIDGDVMQVVLAQRMSIALDVEPINIYRALRHLNPSPYLYFFDLGEFHVVGSSPEILVRVEDGVVTTRPLAGTRRRGRTSAEDLALERELLADPKELAEHLMLIDLGRNDIGRVAETGSVRVTEKMVIERYSHVMHISSTVEGRLRGDRNAMDALRATLPVGTLSGAPKIRAIEIIDELEPVRRGIYGGAVGYLSWNGNMDTAIAIRTAVVKDGRLYIEAGCGVVADSVPEYEWQETLNKGRAIFRAVAMAEGGLAPSA
ncbi:MAG: anthranilate synthase component I [Gammaproteobacteria bacterium]|nr:anthranilate synthase component I [Gammaproteobacteria bacterium]MCP5199444.1 anthranilate synthase component I [Gammaproteobacteria bacterium]